MTKKTPEGAKDMTVYKVARGYVYMADDSGQKYRMPNTGLPHGLPVFVGMRLKDVTFSKP